MEIVDSLPPPRNNRQGSNIDYGYAAYSATPGCAWLLGVPSLLILIGLGAGSNWASHTILAGIWGYLMGLFTLMVIPCAAVIAWRFYKLKKQHEYEEAKKLNEQRLLQEQVKLAKQSNQLVHESRLQGDNVTIQLQYGENGLLKSQNIQVIRAAVLLEQANQANQARVQIAEQKRVGMPALPARVGQQEAPQHEAPVLLPKAPKFWDMVDLITPDRLPLCFVVDDDEQSPTYGQTIPIFGTILDLLSLAVIGKPGRGKTVLLIYYTVILLKYGAEVHIFDPHGVMGELQLLHGRLLPGMPATARVFYYDRKESMTQAVPSLLVEMQSRDELYRPHLENGELVVRKTKHPLLILADELPILADFDLQNKDEYKEINKERKQEGEAKLDVPLMGHLIRRTVLEARKWAMYFIGSSQSIDATVLPTKVTDALNSRIVFYNSERKARMVGLEADVIKEMLPKIRRAGPGMTIYDCARWDAPKIGGIPEISVEDMLEFLGVSMDDLAQTWISDHGAAVGMVGTGSGGVVNGSLASPKNCLEASKMPLNSVSKIRNTGELENPVNALVEPLGSIPDVSPLGPNDMKFTDDQVTEFIKLFRGLGNRKEALRRMKNPRSESGYGVSNRYDRHAKLIIEQYRLEQR